MKRLILFLGICLPLAVVTLHWGDGQALAQQGPTLRRPADIRMEAMKERAEMVQQRRKARMSHADRQAVADRIKAAQAKAAPDKAGKGVKQ